MRFTVAPARAGMLVAVLVVAGCGSGAGASSSAGSSNAAPSLAPSAPTSAPPASSESTPSGWERVEIEDPGFAISLPRGWEVADLTSGDIDQMTELLASDPRFEPFADQLPAMIESGVALWAFLVDASVVDTQFVTNLNVIVQPSGGLSMGVTLATNVSFIERTFDVDVRQEAVELAAGEAAKLEYEPAMGAVGSVHITQYLVMNDESALIATFTRASGVDFEALEAEFLEIMATVAFLP